MSQHLTRNASPGSVPKDQRLVELYHHDHLVGVLALNGSDGQPPLVVVAAAGSPAPMLALLEGGLAGVMIDGSQVHVLGNGMAEFPVWCEECQQDLVLDAGELHRATPERVGRRMPRLKLDASSML